MNYQQLIKDIEDQYSVKVLYLTKSGSHLYGVNTPESDLDLKGIFLPSKESLLLKEDKEYIKLDTNQSNTKNSSNDVDIHLDSLHKWLHLLEKGETGSIDTLFSMWTDNVVYQDRFFTKAIKANYTKLITSKPHAFVGYSIQMQKKYNIKGERYNELIHFLEFLNTYSQLTADGRNKKLEHCEIKVDHYKYITYVQASAPRGIDGDWTYLEVLGRKFAPTVTIDFLIERLQALVKSYGNRVKTTSDNIDYKSLYHSVRVLNECEELLSTGFVTFPSPIANYLLEVKQGKHALEDIMQILEANGERIDEILETTSLPKEIDKQFQQQLLLSQYKD